MGKCKTLGNDKYRKMRSYLLQTFPSHSLPDAHRRWWKIWKKDFVVLGKGNTSC